MPFSNFVASAPVGIAVFDRDMRYQHVNAALAKMHGVPAAEHIGKSAAEISPDLYAQMAPLFRRVIETDQPVSNQIVEHVSAAAPHGQLIWREDWFPIAGPDGQTINVGVIVEEISGQRRIERDLIGMGQRLTSLIDNTPLGVIEWDANRIITRWAGLAEKIFGWSAAEVLGKPATMFDLIGAQDQPESAEPAAHPRDPANRYVIAHSRYRTKSGQFVDCEWYSSVLRNETGAIQAVLSLVLDVTDRKRAEQALQLSESKIQIALNNTPIFVYTTDLDLRYTWIRNLPSAFGLKDAIGRRDDEILPPQAAAASLSVKKEVRDTGVGQRCELKCEIDGERHYYDVSIEPLRDAAGKIYGVAAAGMDITRRIRAEELLKQADRAKDEFLAILAHELRNPLAPMKNALELMTRAHGDPASVGRARAMLDRQLAQMVRLVDDLLDVSRINQNKLELKTTTVELTEIMQQAVDATRPDCERAGTELIVTLPAHPVYLNADPMRLTQVFSNLLNNACKFTPSGGRVEFSARTRAGMAIVTVKDNGIGIAPDMLPRVFDLFTQVDRSLERTEGGLGIGLSLVKRLVGMHGGTATARSEGRGKGSTFTVSVPIIDHPAARQPTARGTAQRLRQKHRILIVDDNRDNADSLAELLRLNGNTVQAAYDGLEAIDKAATFLPDVMIVDLGLPKLSGYEVCRRVRQRPWGANIVMVALTGWGQEADRRKSKRAGFDKHLVKPVDLAALMSLL